MTGVQTCALPISKGVFLWAEFLFSSTSLATAPLYISSQPCVAFLTSLLNCQRVSFPTIRQSAIPHASPWSAPESCRRLSLSNHHRRAAWQHLKHSPGPRPSSTTRPSLSPPSPNSLVRPLLPPPLRTNPTARQARPSLRLVRLGRRRPAWHDQPPPTLSRQSRRCARAGWTERQPQPPCSVSEQAELPQEDPGGDGDGEMGARDPGEGRGDSYEFPEW